MIAESFTFIRMRFPCLVKLHRVIFLQLERKASHSLDQFVEEVSHVFTVVEQHIPVLSVGKIVVAQIGPENRNIQLFNQFRKNSLKTTKSSLMVPTYSL